MLDNRRLSAAPLPWDDSIEIKLDLQYVLGEDVHTHPAPHAIGVPHTACKGLSVDEILVLTDLTAV